jgi:uncharacterized protein YdhG (YjbR/CyaY superfamily)
MTKIFKDFDDYIEVCDENTRIKLLRVRELIREVVPEAQELINYNIPAFTLVKDGKRDEQVMIAAFKSHIGFYPHPTTINEFKSKLGKYKFSKGAVQFPLEEELPETLIKDMVRYRLDQLSSDEGISVS